jgi:hypothetical protein
LLADHWSSLVLSGQAATVHALLAGFPAEARAADAELAAVIAADESARGSLETAERYLGLAERDRPAIRSGDGQRQRHRRPHRARYRGQPHLDGNTADSHNRRREHGRQISWLSTRMMTTFPHTGRNTTVRSAH